MARKAAKPAHCLGPARSGENQPNLVSSALRGSGGLQGLNLPLPQSEFPKLRLSPTHTPTSASLQGPQMHLGTWFDSSCSLLSPPGRVPAMSPQGLGG